jgi:hypothetical protein
LLLFEPITTIILIIIIIIIGEAETANAIIVAANIRTPRASLAICYDERGGEYV